MDDSGRRFGGHDLALICYCSAANGKYDIDGQLICKGYRTDEGVIRNFVGVDIDIDVVREIHNMRKEGWAKTTKLMNKVIQQNNKNGNTKLINCTPEIQKVKDQLANFQMKSL